MKQCRLASRNLVVTQMLDTNPHAAIGWRRPLTRSRLALVGASCLVMIVVAVLAVYATSTPPQSLQVTGYAGHLGEWELNATLSKIAPRSSHDLSGTVHMKHIGMCSKDGPDEKTGEMRAQLSRWSSNFHATLLIDGVACTYSGDMSDAGIGTMACPDRPAVPLMLWVK
jgi:hypothetical protein